FTGWNANADGSGTAFDETTLVTDNITVYAQYTINSYNVKFVDYDGNEIKSESVDHGGAATAPSDPTRPGYTFTGWDEEFDNVTSDLVVTAQYSKNSYNVKFVDHDGNEIKSESVEHGGGATAPADPTRPGYTFIGWDEEFDNITGDLVVTAQYSKNSYNVKFVDHDGTEIKSESVEHGGGATAPSDPTRPGYTFTGWDEEFDNVTGDLVVTAQYTINSYNVKFVDHDGNEIKSESVEHGGGATAPSDPTRPGYTFTGWDEEFDNVTSDLVVTAQYTINSYNVKFVDHDGNELKSESVEHGGGATAPSDPTRPGYTFTGWDEEFDNVTGDLVVTAQYSKNSYTVTYDKNGGDTEAAPGNQTVDYNDPVGTLPTSPTKDGYTFTGWNANADGSGTAFDETTLVTDNITVYAQYTINSYNVKFVDYDGNEIKSESVDHGGAATAPSDPTRPGYTFTGWDEEFDNITGDLVVTAQYIINSYNVKFVDHDGAEIKSESVEHGGGATAPADPTRPGYTFIGWDEEFDNITGDLVVTAQYSKNSYNVKFVDHDGNELKSESVEHGGAATAPSDPTRPGYTFTGWDEEFDNVTGDLVVTAQYSLNKYILHGIITDKKTSEVIGGALVELINPLDGTVFDSFTTGSDGAYNFDDVIAGSYDIHVTHNSYSDNERQISFSYDDAIDGKIREDFELAKYIISLIADPEVIIANGKDETTFTATVTDVDGNPIEGVEVVFDAESSLGDFYNGNTAVTDSEGKASVEYKSVAVGGNTSVTFPVTATVADPIREIYDSEQIMLTFAPGRVKGVIKDSSNKPIAGANVVIRHFDEDGNVDFEFIIVTGEDGEYATAIPFGGELYDVEVTTTVAVNGANVEKTYSQKVHAGVVSGDGTEVFDCEKTIAGLIGALGTDGSKQIINNEDGKLGMKVFDSQGVEVSGATAQINSAGIFMVTGVEKDTEYSLALTYTFEDGREIISGRIKASVGVDGELNLNEILIDPYGTITDASNGDVISGVDVRLYYYDNDKLVELPAIIGFEPNDNANPQDSSVEGKYAYMVYPYTDYYIVATKSGYETYTSPKISVFEEIVRHDFQMKKKTTTTSTDNSNNRGGGNTIRVFVKEVDLANKISTDKNRINYLDSSTFTINYANKLGYTTENVYLSVAIPDGLQFVEGSNGAALENNKVVWSLGLLQANYKGTLNLTLQNVREQDGDEVVKLTSNIYSTTETNVINIEDDESGLSLLLYSDKYNLSHKRYIKGYPDNTVRPEQNITRAEIAAVFARILELEGEVKNTSLYSDVDVEMWAAEYIETATAKGLFVGSEDMIFNPNNPITRAELATVITRYFRETTSNNIEESELNFNDIQNHWAKGYIQEMHRYGIIKGYSDNSFKPDTPISRAEAITMINRMLFRGPLTNVEPSFPDLSREHWAFGDMEESIRTHISKRNEDGSELMVEYIEEPLW
ncbi:MAG: InlB B-repeat-containing protein, partial [Firmicutes bacterium]|nr:InlB B-repeat-containing protein [Bacillota bacterium]